MDRAEGAVAPPAHARRAKALLGWLLALAALAWVLHDVRLSELAPYFAQISWPWLLPAIAFDLLTYVSQGLRWSLLLHPQGRLSWLRATQAIYAGLFTNEVVPLRFGEVVRAFLAARWMGVSMLAVVPSMAVERLFDAAWLALAAALTAIYVPLPGNLARVADTLGIAVLALTAIFVVFAFRARQPLEMPQHGSGFVRALRRAIAQVGMGLRQIGVSRALYLSFAVSLLLPLGQAAAFWTTMRAYGLQRSLWIAVIVFLIVRLGTMLPNAPANVGSFQFFCVLGLTLFGVDKTAATGFSFLVFAVLTVPLWALGLLALTRSGVTISEIRDRWEALRRSNPRPGS